MSSAEFYKKQDAQLFIANSDVSHILEALVTELARTRPSKPVEAMIHKLDLMSALEEQRSRANGAPVVMPPIPPARRLVLLLGLSGSGKTAQCSRLTSALHGVYCSPSLFQQEVMNGGHLQGTTKVYIPAELQREVLEQMAVRSSLPPELITRLIANRVAYEEQTMMEQAAASGTSTCSNIYYFMDGYPNTIEQALALEAVVGEVALAVALRCPANVAASRSAARTTSSSMRRSSLAPPKTADMLRSSTALLEEYWKAKQKLRVVDASKDIATVTKTLLALIQTE